MLTPGMYFMLGYPVQGEEGFRKAGKQLRNILQGCVAAQTQLTAWDFLAHSLSLTLWLQLGLEASWEGISAFITWSELLASLRRLLKSLF